MDLTERAIAVQTDGRIVLSRLRILDARNLPFSHDSVLKAGSTTTSSYSSNNKNNNGNTFDEGVRRLRKLALVNHDLNLRLDRVLHILSNTVLAHLALDPALVDPILPIKPLRLSAATRRLLAQFVLPRLRKLGVTSTLDDFADVGIGGMLMWSGMGAGSVSRVGSEGLRVLRCDVSPQRYTYAFPRALLFHLLGPTTLELRSCPAYTDVLADLTDTDGSGAGEGCYVRGWRSACCR
ncbi:hypothetical protein BOTBODRAFT_181472 [Botryobasidium botryosum FD-172 SS1]|uniref:Uncharacterized protein n=1 Tax=Botryobasidium botryosum (strain FD-172 SS1) TaxID=930990 RepID=A0A067M4N4_BOTB1|nr:hypothetical protein BOTBODRAFT_181472 [Botryobasidium botryosum FD-172 SS1]